MNERSYTLKKSAFGGGAFITLIIGLLFFVNPMISMLDILPDFIGCALVMYASNKLRAVSADMDVVFAFFRNILIVSVVRLAVIFVMPQTDEVMMLTLTLVFALAEFGTAVFAFPALFEALSGMSIKFGNKISVRPEIRQVSVAFFAARGFFSILPHITSVFNESEDILAPQPEYVMDYSSLLMLANIILTLVFAVFFLALTVPVLWKFASDRELLSLINAGITERRSSDSEYFLRRTLCIALSVAAYCHLFLIDIIGDGINYMPDFIFGGFLVWALLLMRNYVGNTRAATVSAAVYTVLSAVNFFVYNDFMKKRFFASFDTLIFRFPEEYIFAVSVSFAETVSLAFTAVLFYRTLKIFIKDRIDYDVPECFVRTKNIKDKFVKNTVTLSKVYIAILIVVAVSGTAFTALLHPFPYYWMIHFVLNVALFAISSVLFLRMRSGVITKYQRPEDADRQ